MVKGNLSPKNESRHPNFPGGSADSLGIKSLEDALFGLQNKIIPYTLKAFKGLKPLSFTEDPSLRITEEANKKFLSILLIEDNKTDYTIYLKMLKDDQIFKVTHVETLNAAIDSLIKEEFQLILLDLHLPDEAGINTFIRINEQAPDIPIIVITGMDDEDLALKIMRSGAQDYLIKGFVTKDVLIRAIRYSIERYKLLERIYSLSLIDDLTSLYNRRAFLINAERYLKLAKRNSYNMLLFFIDLDNMKKINDNFGHLEGDLAIKNTAGILKRTFRDSDLVARMGGDEFIALMFVGDLDISFNSISARFKEHIDNFNTLKQNLYDLSLSVGAVFYEISSDNSLDTLMDKADIALYEHKKMKNDKNRNFIYLFK